MASPSRITLCTYCVHPHHIPILKVSIHIQAPEFIHRTHLAISLHMQCLRKYWQDFRAPNLVQTQNLLNPFKTSLLNPFGQGVSTIISWTMCTAGQKLLNDFQSILSCANYDQYIHLIYTPYSLPPSTMLAFFWNTLSCLQRPSVIFPMCYVLCPCQFLLNALRCFIHCELTAFFS